jgi:hypothetical protein
MAMANRTPAKGGKMMIRVRRAVGVIVTAGVLTSMLTAAAPALAGEQSKFACLIGVAPYFEWGKDHWSRPSGLQHPGHTHGFGGNHTIFFARWDQVPP